MQQHRLRVFSLLVIVAFQIATLSAQPYAYVSNLSSNTVSVINTANSSIVTQISVPMGPTGMVVSPDASTVYVASQSANTVSIINTSSNSIAGSISVGSTPTQIAMSPNGNYVLAINQASDQVTLIDTRSKSVVATLGVGSRPSSVAFNADSSRAYVTNLWSGNVSIIDVAAKAVTGAFEAGMGPSGVAVASNGRIYVTNEYANSITVHDASSGKLLTTMSGFTFPNWIALTPNAAKAYVTNGNAGSVSVIDLASNTVSATIGVGSLPTSVALSTDGSRAFVTNEYGFSVSVIDTGSNSVAATVARVGVYPVVVALAPAPQQPGIAPPPVPPAPVCTYSVSASNTSFGSAGGSGTVSVNVPQGCAWTAASNNTDWISAGSSNGNGSATLTFNVAANNSTGGRSGSLTIAGQNITITETGITCSYVLSANTISVGANGGNGSVNVNAPGGCPWSVTSDSGWLTAGSNSGAGSGTVSFAAASNSTMSGRSGNLNIGGQTFNVSQAGSAFSPIRVNCGGPSMNDSDGNAWGADDQRSRAITMTPIAGTPNPGLYQKEAWSTGTLQYQFNVPNGNFTVNLHFAEIYLTQKGQRTFDIVVNGQTMRSNFDILTEVGVNTANLQSFPINVSNGQIVIQLVPRTGSAKISGIEIR